VKELGGSPQPRISRTQPIPPETYHSNVRSTSISVKKSHIFLHTVLYCLCQLSWESMQESLGLEHAQFNILYCAVSTLLILLPTILGKDDSSNLILTYPKGFLIHLRRPPFSPFKLQRSLKSGLSYREFDRRFSTSGFFSWISFPRSPKYPLRVISNVYENSRGYSQICLQWQ
jgi:hypothetical protein